MGLLRSGIPDRLDGDRMPDRAGGFGSSWPGSGWLVRVLGAAGTGAPGLGWCEELVHDLGAGGDDGA